jgi:hypothetical protein
MWQKYAALIEVNINHHTSEQTKWVNNSFGDVITDLRLPVLYVHKQIDERKYVVCQTTKHPTAKTAKICSWNGTLHAQPSIIESVISPS